MYFYFILLLILNIGVLFVFQTPVIALVGNDACWSQIAREQVPMFGSSIGCDLEVRHNLVHQAKAGIVIKPMHQGQKESKETIKEAWLPSSFHLVSFDGPLLPTLFVPYGSVNTLWLSI